MESQEIFLDIFPKDAKLRKRNLKNEKKKKCKKNKKLNKWKKIWFFSNLKDKKLFLTPSCLETYFVLNLTISVISFLTEAAATEDMKQNCQPIRTKTAKSQSYILQINNFIPI